MSVRLTFYNLSVSLETDDYTLLSYLNRFISAYYTLEQRGFSPNVPVEDKLFIGKIKDTGIYQLHNNQFVHFYHYLKGMNYTLVIDEKINKADYPCTVANMVVRDGWVLRENQIPVSEFILNKPVKSKLVPLATGSGKAQPLSAGIKVPGGWSTMGEMHVGTSIIAKDGSVAKVNGIYPQGYTPVYEVSFEDGRVTEASSEHLWKLHVTYNSVSGYRVIDTRVLKELLETTPAVISVDLVEPEQSKDVPLQIDPYILGNNLRHVGVDRSLLAGYLNASHMQRIRLLQGLLDSYGTISLDGFITYHTSDIGLRDLVIEVARSVGGIAGYTANDAPKPQYIISIKHKHAHYLTASRVRITEIEKAGVTSSASFLRVTSVKYIGMKETQCISIDHPDKLYITDNYIVTHNTFISLHAIAQLKQRLAIVILPAFIDKWVSDIATIHEACTKDVMVIRGSDAMASLIDLAKSNSLNNNYYIFSNKTLQQYINHYETNSAECIEVYGASPLELMPLLGIGTMLIDESHMHFHSIFKILLYSNVKFQIGLSATLISEDPVISRVYKVTYPDDCVYGDSMIKRYIDVYPIAYPMGKRYDSLIKTTNYGSNVYAHTAFEQSILRKKFLLDIYTNIIKTTISDYYLYDYRDNDKLLIFVATVKLATHLSEVFKEEYSDKVVNRYCEEDPYENLMTSDIIISTVISAGTAVDVPNLRVVIQTVCISSPVSNIQSLGRLRELKDRDTKFCYLYCNNIVKHKQYHMKRVELFKDRVANISYRQSRLGF